jgi:hypothetical protein
LDCLLSASYTIFFFPNKSAMQISAQYFSQKKFTVRNSRRYAEETHLGIDSLHQKEMASTPSILVYKAHTYFKIQSLQSFDSLHNLIFFKL